jgi:hypothetical protein
MSQYHIYHAIDPLQLVLHDASAWHDHRETHYRHIATVELSSLEGQPLERVFALTNHSVYPWTVHPEIIWFPREVPLRSLSVGDVFVEVATKQAWMVMPYGLQALEGKGAQQ